MGFFLILLIFLSLSILCWYYFIFQRMKFSEDLETCEFFKYAAASLAGDITFEVGKIVEKLGICSQIKFLRLLLMSGTFPGDQELRIRDEQFDNVPVTIYEPKHPFNGLRRCIIYLHGGVGMIGTIRAYAGTCQRLALNTETMVVDVGYRLAPEDPHPAQLEDCMLAVIYFLKEAKNYGVDPNRIILVGDSSGGTLVAVVCHQLVARKDLPRIRAQMLIYPAIQMVDITLPSYQQNLFCPILSAKRALTLLLRFLNEEPVDLSEFMKNAHVPDFLSVKYKKWISADHIQDAFKVRGHVPITPTLFSEKLYKASELGFREDLCPLLAEDDVIRQLPETFLLTCEYDILRDDGLLYKKRLEDNGVPVTWLHLTKGFHGIMFKNSCMCFEFKEAEKGWEHIVEFTQRF